MYHMCAWVPEAREGVGSPELELDTYELSCMRVLGTEHRVLQGHLSSCPSFKKLTLDVGTL